MHQCKIVLQPINTMEKATKGVKRMSEDDIVGSPPIKKQCDKPTIPYAMITIPPQPKTINILYPMQLKDMDTVIKAKQNELDTVIQEKKKGIGSISV